MTALLEDPSGLCHLGLTYTDTDDLMTAVAPRVERALERGEAVSTLFDRRTSRLLRDVLGDRADTVAFASPHAAAPRAEDFLRQLRAIVDDARGRRLTVLTQYTAFASRSDDLLVGESGINLVLSDLPVTVVCACPGDAPPATLDTVRRSHPAWARGGTGAVDNPAFRPPEDRSPTPSAVWGGEHVLRLRFGDTADLVRVRTRVAALAAEVGLRGEPAQAAVLAVHEAAVLACDDAGAADAGGGDGTDGTCVLDVWTADGRLVAEVHGPRPGPAGPPGGGDDRLPRHRLRMAGPLAVVRLFCPDVTARETAAGRTTRIVAGP